VTPTGEEGCLIGSEHLLLTLKAHVGRLLLSRAHAADGGSVQPRQAGKALPLPVAGGAASLPAVSIAAFAQ